MRKWAMTGLLVLLAAMLSGCGAGEAADTYLEGNDYQYMQWVNGMFFPKVQQTEDGCYFLYEGYLYYLDEQTDTILPLCNKADCLHEQEQRLPDIRPEETADSSPSADAHRKRRGSAFHTDTALRGLPPGAAGTAPETFASATA